MQVMLRGCINSGCVLMQGCVDAGSSGFLLWRCIDADGIKLSSPALPQLFFQPRFHFGLSLQPQKGQLQEGLNACAGLVLSCP